jgi:hypothetical protein
MWRSDVKLYCHWFLSLSFFVGKLFLRDKQLFHSEFEVFRVLKYTSIYSVFGYLFTNFDSPAGDNTHSAPRIIF